MKTCPDCAEQVQEAARICRFCGHRFDREKSARRWRRPLVGLGVLLALGALVAAGLVLGQSENGDAEADAEGGAEACVTEEAGTPVPCSVGGAIPASEYDEDATASDAGDDEAAEPPKPRLPDCSRMIAQDKAGRCRGENRRFEIVYIDDTLDLQTLDASITSVETASEVGDRFITERATGEYLIVSLAVRNQTNAPKDFSPFQEQTALEVDDKIYNEAFDAENTPGTRSFLWKGEAIGPDLTQTGTVIYDVPPEVADDVLSDDTEAGLLVKEFGSGRRAPLGSIVLREQTG